MQERYETKMQQLTARKIASLTKAGNQGKP